MQIVTPSRWLADCARQSALMSDWPVEVIPNALDTEAWSPIEPRTARYLLGLPPAAPLLLFGAYGGAVDPRKGFDLLADALARLRGQVPDLRLLVIGQAEPEEVPDLGFPVHYGGRLSDDLSLRVIYSAADAMLIPSRQDNLPNTGVEAHACGTPVIAFDIGGLPDIVTHEQTGWLARPFDPEDLAQGIRWVLTDAERHARLCEQARAEAVRRFAYPVVAQRYRALYAQAIEQQAIK
jgi:glycosyltransferase involved in cell wall biosynthesis